VRNVPESVELIQLPAPVDERDLFDFTGGEELIASAYELANQALDTAETARRQRRQLRRPFWRRDAG
jgi:hypothetical protein